MNTFETVDAQLREYGISGNKGEKQELAKMLRDGERIEFAVSGTYNGANGLLAATEQRILFVDKTFTGKITNEDFPYDRVTGVGWDGGWTSGTVSIIAASHRAQITLVNKKSGPTFVEKVRVLINEPRSVQSLETEIRPVDDLTSQLERLAALRDRGILTDEEFTQQKGKLLK